MYKIIMLVFIITAGILAGQSTANDVNWSTTKFEYKNDPVTGSNLFITLGDGKKMYLSCIDDPASIAALNLARKEGISTILYYNTDTSLKIDEYFVISQITIN